MYIYIASIAISYLIVKSNFENIEKKLRQSNLNIYGTASHKHNDNISLFIISCIPMINIITVIASIVSPDALYNTFKQAQCEIIIDDNEKLLNKYEKICNSGNEEKRRTIEKKIIIASTLINSGFNKEETLNKIMGNCTEKQKVKKLGTIPTIKKSSK